jgi:phospholipid transport system substrate-binding protein
MDFEAMAKLVLGKHWRTATSEQRSRFVGEFKALLIRTYRTSLAEYSDEKVSFLPFREGEQPEKLATVRSEIIRGNGPSIPINYSLRYKKDDGWKVYDIGIEGVSLVTNYRSSFAREINQNGMDYLIESLHRRNAGKAADEAQG